MVANLKSENPRVAPGLAATLGIVILLAAGPARAQRGQDFAPANELAASPNPSQGFPGLFDTELAPQGTFVANLPTTSLLYGVTRRLTMGTIAASFSSVLFGPPGASLYARYLLGGTTWFRSTVDGLMVSAAFNGSDGRDAFRVGLFTSNTQFVISPRQHATIHGWYARGQREQSDSPAKTGTAVVVGATYSVSLAPWATLHVGALYLASLRGAFDAPGKSFDVDATNILSPLTRLVPRATVSMRRGRWLFDAGLLRAGPFPVPWFNAAVQLGS